MKFFVNHQNLKPMLHSLVVSDTVNYLQAQVVFQSEDWAGLEKWLHFRQGETVYDFRLNDSDCVEAGAGMNLPAGLWQVSVHGVQYENGKLIRRITTAEVEISVEQSGILGEEQSTITPGTSSGTCGVIAPQKTYIKEESRRVADLVMSRQSEESFAFAFLADMHCGSEYEIGGKWQVNDEAVEDAGLALAELMDSCPLDAVVLGGDLASGSYKSTNEKTKKENSDCTAYLRTGGDVPMLFVQGNHDDAPYMATENRMTDADLYSWFNRKNLLAGAVLDGQRKSGGYGYLDFDSQKVRLIYLNTDEKSGWESDKVGSGGTNNYLNAGNISGRQLDFLANTALNFSGKGDASQWTVIVCSHRPLNEGAGTYTCSSSGKTYNANISNVLLILDAYVSGSSDSITHNGEAANYDFSGGSRANISCCVHGHNHRYSKESLGSSGILSIGCPNVMNGRERLSDNDRIYGKTPGTAESTAFCVITVDRAAEKIYADHYGAGYDRAWSFDGSSFEDNETPAEPDIPDIPDEPDEPEIPTAYTNQIRISVDSDGSVYNGVGYADGVRLNSSGAAISYDGYSCTGFMPCKPGDIVRLKNIYMMPNEELSGNMRICFYDANKNHLGQTNATGARGLLDGIHDDSGNLKQFVVKEFSGYDIASAKYLRICSTQLNSTSIITINEEIV